MPVVTVMFVVFVMALLFVRYLGGVFCARARGQCEQEDSSG
jgi:hypothetical protein